MDGVTAATDATLRRAESAENFPVALRLLPADLRADLRAVYDVVRTVDELGDSADGDREALLTRFAHDLSAVWDDTEPDAAVLRALVPATRRRGLAEEPFQ